MLGLFFTIDSLLVCAFTSMAQCRVKDGGVVYISEFIMLCKQGAHTWLLPWVCVAAFTALMFVQMGWMYGVARAWYAASIDAVHTTNDSAAWWAKLFWTFAATAVAGLVLIVLFDWRGGSATENSAHHTGVAMLATGTFIAMQMIWAALRAGDNNLRLRGNLAAQVPWYSWVECDVVFVVLLGLFLLTAQLNIHMAVGAFFEFGAFVLLLAQTTWLFVLCAERDGSRISAELQTLAEATSPERPAKGNVLWALLCAYCVEALIVILFVL